MPPNRQFYVAHATFTLTNGDSFNRGDVLRGADAAQFETDVAAGNTDINNATPVAADPGAPAPISSPVAAAATTAPASSAGSNTST